MQRNQGMDMQWMAGEERPILPERPARHVDTRGLQSGEHRFLEHIFFLLMGALICAVMTTLRKPDQWEAQREILQQRVDIIRRGSLAGPELHRDSDEGGRT